MTLRCPKRMAAATAARVALIALAAAVALATVAALVPGCTKQPADPAWNNPFDPNGPGGGDPFDVRAVLMGNNVLVEWDVPGNPGIAHFEVLHSTDRTHYDIANDQPLGPTATSFTHKPTSPSPPAYGVRNWYKVRALDAAGNPSSISREAAAETLIGPFLEIAGGAATTPTRHVGLKILTAVGDSLELAENGEFTGALRLPAKPGEADSIPDYDLGPASGNNVVKDVWLRVKFGPVYSPASHATIRTSFQPDLRPGTAAATVASRRVTVLWERAGVVATQLTAGADSAAARTALPTAPTVAPDSFSVVDDSYTGTLLTTEPSRQWIYARFLGDFGYVWIDTTHAIPDRLTSAKFTLAGGAQSTLATTIPLASTAVATHMRFNENPDSLGSTPWRVYADTIQFSLTPNLTGHDELRRVYGQYVNDWYVSPTLRDSIIVVPVPAPR